MLFRDTEASLGRLGQRVSGRESWEKGWTGRVLNSLPQTFAFYPRVSIN